MPSRRPKYDHTQYEQARIQALFVRLLHLEGKCPGPCLRVALGDEFDVSERALTQCVEQIQVVSGGNQRSSAQQGVIELNLDNIRHQTERGLYNEYAQFASDPDIGDIYVHNWDETILVTLAHELAHVIIQQTRLPNPSPHGPGFQQVYRFIREGFLNPYLEFVQQSLGTQSINTEQSRIYRKLQKLRAMAEHTHSNEHEAARARRQLEALIDQYALDPDALHSADQIPIIERVLPQTRLNRVLFMDRLWSRFGDWFDVRMLFQTRHHPIKSQNAVVIGSPSDVENACYFAEVIERTIRSEFERYVDSTAYRATPTAQKYAAKSEFIRAMQIEIANKLDMTCARRGETIKQNKRDRQALVQLKQDQIQDELIRRYPKIAGHYRGSYNTSKRHPSAQAAGRQAGLRFSGAKPVNTQRHRGITAQ